MDPDLTSLGTDQAARLAERAQTWSHVDEIWISPARRSQQTAAPLVEALGAPARTLDWLLEVQGPDLEGKSPEEVRAAFHGARYRPREQWWTGMPGGEDLRGFTTRIVRGMAQELGTLGAHREEEAPHWRGLPKGRRVVIVSHAGTSGVLLGHLLGVPPVAWSWERFRLGHAAMAVLRTSAIADGLIFGLHGFNDRVHLPKRMHTI